MSIKKINKNSIKNLLLKIILKKGKHIMAKNLILNSSINISKDIKNFYRMFENMIKNSTFPFKIVKNKNKYEYKYVTNKKSISNFINKIIDSYRNTTKRISFDFYFKNEINKILANSNNINNIKTNVTNSCNNVSFVPLTLKKKFNENDIDIITSKQSKIKKTYKHFNTNFYCDYNVLYSNNIKTKTQTEYNNLILQQEVKNLNFI